MLQTVLLAAIQIATFSVFTDRWANRSENTISQFLYEDDLYRVLFTFYTLLHLAVLYVTNTSTPQHVALISSAVGWIWLIICSNHGSRTLHIIGAVIYIVSLFVFTFIHATDYPFTAKIIICTITAATVVLALVFAYYETHRSSITYIIEHSLFLMCQIMYAFFTHLPPERLVFKAAITPS